MKKLMICSIIIIKHHMSEQSSRPYNNYDMVTLEHISCNEPHNRTLGGG